MMKLFGFDHPFYRPLWIRIAIVVFCFAWAGLELKNGSLGWALLFAALGGLSAWNFFVAYKPRDTKTGNTDDA